MCGAQRKTKRILLLFISLESERVEECEKERCYIQRRFFWHIFKVFFSYLFIYIQQTNQLYATMSLLFCSTDFGMAKENERFIWIEENIPSVMDFESEKLK